MRVFGRWNLRVAVAARLVSKNRFGTRAMAAKTISDRIVLSKGIEDSSCFSVALLVIGAIEMPKALKNGRSCDLVQWRDSLFSFLIVFEKHSKVFSLNLDRGRQLSTRIVREDDGFPSCVVQLVPLTRTSPHHRRYGTKSQANRMGVHPVEARD
jgi:hypothetical protein